MGLDIPDLDDRTYADIVEDALKLLPVYTDEWTDHNAHDPGVTFVELFAWLAESYSYQLDRVTDRHVRKYLRLLGVRPRPPEPASARLKLEVTGDRVEEGHEIEAGEQLTVDDGEGFVGVFETTKPVTLTRTRVARVVSVHGGTVTDNSAANDGYGLSFLAFGERAGLGSAMYVGFDRDPFAAAATVDLTVDYRDDDLPARAVHEADDPAFEPSVELAWEFYSPTEGGAEPAVDPRRDDENWRAFVVRRDQTSRLYGGGAVALRVHVEGTESTAWTGETARLFGREDEEPLVWIRCRVVTPGYEVPPQLDSLQLDVVPVRHQATHDRVELRRVEEGPTGAAPSTETTALPGQTFAFDRAPVLAAEIIVDGRRWTEVPDFDASGPDDDHYVLNPAAGTVRFGDGARGRVPEPSQPVVATTYIHGGGADGNVPRSAACRFVRGGLARGVDVRLVDDAEGGTDAESTGAALVRAREELARPSRAVTLDDYRRVALATPGLRFGRATAQIRRRPAAPRRDDARGDNAYDDTQEVQVVVVPYSTLHPPRPSAGFLAAIERHLDRHRLLTDRVVVEPPRYVGVGVDAEIRIDPAYTPAGRVEAVEAALDRFLDPLGDDDGDGWPFGRPVYISELYETIERVPGVVGVLDVTVRARGEERVDGDGNVLLGATALPDPSDHGVRVSTEGGS